LFKKREHQRDRVLRDLLFIGLARSIWRPTLQPISRDLERLCPSHSAIPVHVEKMVEDGLYPTISDSEESVKHFQTHSLEGGVGGSDGMLRSE
jgi:hypothetical protein